jgi:hypothetical protein
MNGYINFITHVVAIGRRRRHGQKRFRQFVGVVGTEKIEQRRSGVDLIVDVVVFASVRRHGSVVEGMD